MIYREREEMRDGGKEAYAIVLFYISFLNKMALL